MSLHGYICDIFATLGGGEQICGKKCVNRDKNPFAIKFNQNSTKNMFIRHLWQFFTTLWHIFKAFALRDKIQQSKVGSFRILRL